MKQQTVCAVVICQMPIYLRIHSFSTKIPSKQVWREWCNSIHGSRWVQMSIVCRMPSVDVQDPKHRVDGYLSLVVMLWYRYLHGLVQNPLRHGCSSSAWIVLQENVESYMCTDQSEEGVSSGWSERTCKRRNSVEHASDVCLVRLGLLCHSDCDDSE